MRPISLSTSLLSFLCAATVAVPVFAADPAPVPAAPVKTAHPLRILLTNDDGWDAPGIRAVYAELAKVGHDITVVAPKAKQSGVGGAVTYSGSLMVETADTSEFPEYAGAKVTTIGAGPSGKGGTPSDCVAFALSNVYAEGEAPDLVVSGTNVGQNTSLVVNHSGTMGAAISALGAGIPAIAISAEKASDYEPEKAGETDYPGAAAYLAGFIEQIAPRIVESQDLPGDIGVNINYPMNAPKGVMVVDFADSDPFEVTYTRAGDTSEYKIEDRSVGDQENLSIDTGALYQGFVTVTAIDPYYSVESAWLDELVAGTGTN